jgi:hypothetical protein
MKNDHEDDADSTEHQQNQAPFSQADRPHPIVLTSQIHLLQL